MYVYEKLLDIITIQDFSRDFQTKNLYIFRLYEFSLLDVETVKLLLLQLNEWPN